MRGIKCLSIRQPYAGLIIHEGKDIENRLWATNYRGPLLVHAGLKPFVGARCLLDHRMPFGGIVGIVDVVDCVTESPSEWFCGPYGFVLENPRPLLFMPCKGKLRFFSPPESIHAALAEAGVLCA